jgi:phospholipid/cholesterol/gamma-HCH transport system substrate-binding protein
MQKQAPTLGRILVMAAFALSCFGLLLYLWVAFGGGIMLKPKGYRVHVRFGEATQLAQQADVRISGVPVGKVVSLKLGPGNTTDATLQIDPRYAPLPRDVRAILRQKTLLGETFVELTPGTKAGGSLAEGGTVPETHVSKTVELDEILRAFDPYTRRSFEVWMQSVAAGLRGRGADLNAALGNLDPFATDTTTLLRLLDEQGPAVRQLISNTGTVFGALSERSGQLTGLIRNSNAVFGTIADRNQQLQEAFRAFPTFEQESSLTLERLNRFARNTDPLVTQLRPVARELSPTFQSLARLAPPFQQFFVNLGPLIAASKAGLPAFDRFLADLRPALGQLDPFTRSLNPFLRFIAQYLPELDGFVGNIVGATQASELNARNQAVHFLRTLSPFSPEGLALYPRRLAMNRPNPYRFPGAMNALASGLAVFESRQCADGLRPVPSFPPNFAEIVGGVTADAAQKIFNLAFRGNPSAVPAPPCRLQGPTPGFGADYPHLTADPPRSP